MQLDRFRCPDGPVAQESADHSANNGRGTSLNFVRRDEVDYDVVVVAGVKSDIIAATFGNGADHGECAITVEGGNLDCASVFNLTKAAPKFDWKLDAADG